MEMKVKNKNIYLLITMEVPITMEEEELLSTIQL